MLFVQVQAAALRVPGQPAPSAALNLRLAAERLERRRQIPRPDPSTGEMFLYIADGELDIVFIDFAAQRLANSRRIGRPEHA